MSSNPIPVPVPERDPQGTAAPAPEPKDHKFIIRVLGHIPA